MAKDMKYGKSAPNANKHFSGAVKTGKKSGNIAVKGESSSGGMKSGAVHTSNPSGSKGRASASKTGFAKNPY